MSFWNIFSTWNMIAPSQAIRAEHSSGLYLTIRLRARDIYEVIVDEGEARINYHFIEIESE